jgi:hypothetical protein
MGFCKTGSIKPVAMILSLVSTPHTAFVRGTRPEKHIQGDEVQRLTSRKTERCDLVLMLEKRLSDMFMLSNNAIGVKRENVIELEKGDLEYFFGYLRGKC